MKTRRIVLCAAAMLLCAVLAGCAQLEQLPFWPFEAGPDPAAVQEFFLKGQEAVLARDYAAAAAAFNQLLSIDPENVDAMLWLARCQILDGNAAAAVQTLTAAHGKAPRNAEILRYLAKAQYDAGNFAEAEAAYLKLQEVAPDDASVYAGLEKVYAASGELEKLNALRGLPSDTPADGGDWPDDDGWTPVSTTDYDSGDEREGEGGGAWATIPPELLVAPEPTEATADVTEPPPTPSPTVYDPNLPQVEDETGWDEYGG